MAQFTVLPIFHVSREGRVRTRLLGKQQKFYKVLAFCKVDCCLNLHNAHLNVRIANFQIRSEVKQWVFNLVKCFTFQQKYNSDKLTSRTFVNV